MPSVPMLIPSATVMVPKMMDFPPAASAPAPASRARASICMLHGVSMLQVEATPTTVFLKSSSLKPTARSMERLGARSEPSCTIEEYFRRRSGLDMAGVVLEQQGKRRSDERATINQSTYHGARTRYRQCGLDFVRVSALDLPR